MKTFKTVAEAYVELRKPYTSETYPGRSFHVPAEIAFWHAKRIIEIDQPTRKRWQAEGGAMLSSKRELQRHEGNVAFVVLPDEGADFEDLCGDSFNPEVNTDIPAKRLEQERKDFFDKVNREGVWCYDSYFRDAQGEWEHADSICGIVGGEMSGYDVDLMRSALSALDTAREEAAAMEDFAEEIDQ